MSFARFHHKNKKQKTEKWRICAFVQFATHFADKLLFPFSEFFSVENIPVWVWHEQSEKFIVFKSLRRVFVAPFVQEKRVWVVKNCVKLKPTKSGFLIFNRF